MLISSIKAPEPVSFTIVLLFALAPKETELAALKIPSGVPAQNCGKDKNEP